MLIPANPASNARPTDLTDLPNVSFAMAEDLRRVGIRTVRDLQNVGTENAWLAVRGGGLQDHSIHSLLAIEGALLGVPWAKLPSERRFALILFANEVLTLARQSLKAS
jgi:DNA transformation protein